MRVLWLWIIVVLLMAGYVVPYTLLSGVPYWSGAFVFWLIFGVLVWLALVAVVLRWRPERDAGGDKSTP